MKLHEHRPGCDEASKRVESGQLSRRTFIGGAAGLILAMSDKARRVLAGEDHHAASEKKEVMTREDVEQHLEGNVRWITAEELQGMEDECIDDRVKNLKPCLPGGDTGFLMTSLGALEQEYGRELTEEQIGRIVTAYMRSLGHPLYFHTDEHSAEALAHHLGIMLAQLDSTLLNPGALRSKVEAAVTDPAFVGCGDVRLKLQQQNVRYTGVRPAMAAGVIRSAYRAAWDGGAKLDLQRLEGGHAAGAALSVQTEGDVPLKAGDHFPLIRPHKKSGSSLFVVDKAAVPLVANGASGRIVEAARQQQIVVDPSALSRRMQGLWMEHLGVTTGALASDVPKFTARFHPKKPGSRLRVEG